MLEQPDSSAYVPGVPAASRSHATSPRGVRSPSAHSTARRTVGHMVRAWLSSPVTRYSCHTPTATYAAWWLSAAGSVTAPPAVDRGHDPSARCVARSHAYARRAGSRSPQALSAIAHST